MAQAITALGIGATGIVGTLAVIGLILKGTGVASSTGDFAISGSVLIGITLGLLGIFGVAKRVIG